MSRASFRCATRLSFDGVLGAARGVVRIEARDEVETGPGIRPGYDQDIVHPGSPRSAAAGASRGGSSGRNAGPGRSCFGSGPGRDLIGSRLCQRSGPSRG